MNPNRKLFITICLTVICGLLCPADSAAQATDEKEIEKVIDNYIVGWRTADKELLKEIFDLDAGVVLWIDKKAEPEHLKSMTLAELANGVITQEEFGIGYTIEDLQITDSQLAVVFVRIPIHDSYYIDCLQLQKINGRWKIVLKSFVYFPKE